ncbi:lecithin retinol acyltransferase family protein [Tuwongella immobilis]|uniref:LRAT domain-containing protein n=1 Tax=Tuwongella immobilis TaxID=692036 RepID=A0A6C2YRM8_9BACT|nr:lecithin retinol acyltransferase family protein [Tuwongella immobilis]VIP04308.1 Uncharacterized protein OS=Synechococcus elongatus (strain PCC 7942) GN=Synpcc7942_2528 PE=4 SV=1: LRAT [Tuwongella immobilis]VTS05979.1 Uncharacterized protein OS=Synechococcus elongatus (strain PCC 7942) GN=Synpcc7942_2528 PE=4 SV=1: LRAT [Tuwongella immobilis]
MAKGDHLIVAMGVIDHHGIDLGDGTVVHWSSGMPGDKDFTNPRDIAARQAASEIRRAPLSEFGSPETIRIREYADGWDADTVVERAVSRLGERGYNVATNNCEHFATWCKIGEHASHQVEMVTRRVTATGTKVITRTVAKTITRTTARMGGKSLLRAASPWLLLADAAQLLTEWQATRSGAAPKQAEDAGKAVGCASSVGIGTLVGGPVGAIVGLGIWAAGEWVGSKITEMQAIPESKIHLDSPAPVGV